MATVTVSPVHFEDYSGIHVAEYLTTLPPRAVLVERLHQAAQRAQFQIQQHARD